MEVAAADIISGPEIDQQDVNDMEDTPDRLKKAGASLLAVITTFAHLRSEAQGIAPDGSEAGDDLEFWKSVKGASDEVLGAFESGQRSIALAEDLARSLVDVLNVWEPRPATIATLLRSMLESLGRAFWLLESGIGPLVRAERYMNDLHTSNNAALAYAGARGLPGDAREAGEQLALAIGRFFERSDVTRRKVDEKKQLLALISDVASYTNSKYGVDSDPTEWADHMEKVYWFLSALVHGDKVGVDAVVAWGVEDLKGQPILLYPNRIFEECLGVALLSFIAVLRGAAVTLGYDLAPMDSIIEHHLPKAVAAMSEGTP